MANRGTAFDATGGPAFSLFDYNDKNEVPGLSVEQISFANGGRPVLDERSRIELHDSNYNYHDDSFEDDLRLVEFAPVGGKMSLDPKIIGFGMIIFGAVEVAVGIVTFPSTSGASTVAVLHGTTGMGTGLAILISGEFQDTLKHKIVEEIAGGVGIPENIGIRAAEFREKGHKQQGGLSTPARRKPYAVELIDR